MHKVRRMAWVALASLVLAACSSLTENPGELTPQVTFGTPDGTDHPWVVSILFSPGGEGFYSCTGTLLSEYVVLTAAHCLEEGGNLNVGTWVRNDPSIDRASETPVGGSLADWLSTYWVSGTPVPHPDYDDYAQFPSTYDVGLILLDEPIEVGTYGALPELDLLTDLTTGKRHRDRLFTVVGYGLQGYIPSLFQNDWERYVGQTTLVNVNSAYAGDEQSAGFTNNPGKGNGSGGSCFGDSGGPLFWQDTNIVGAVVSFGFTPCIGIDYQFRMDTDTAQEFVNPYLHWTP